MTPEGKIKKMVRELLDPYRDRGELHYDMPVMGGYGPPMLDFHCCHRGRYFVIETKAPGAKPTPRQNTTMGRIERAGGTVFTVDGPESLHALAKWLG